jgi:type IV secretion system protein VirB11
MSSAPLPPIASPAAERTALALTLRPLRPLLSRADVMELCINTPGEAFVETSRGWLREELPFADFEWCTRLAKLAANSTQQRIDATSPLLSGSLPTGERVQIVMPPATTAGCVAITIRRPATAAWSIEDLAQRGIFHRARRANTSLDDTEQRLLRLLASGDFRTFMTLAVRSR